MKYLFVFFFVISGVEVMAKENFRCSIFATTDGGFAKGSLSLSGADFAEQQFSITVSDSQDGELKAFDGVISLRGSVEFTRLLPSVQESIQNAIRHSKKPGLATGPLLVFSNASDASPGTLNVYLMPSGEIAYLEIGFLPVLCI